MEELLAQTINVAVELELIEPQALEHLVVDSTVQHKAIAHPSDSRLLEVARVKLVAAAKNAGVQLKQTFAKEGQRLRRKAAGYAHARQFKRLRRTIERQATIVGRLAREIERKATALTQAAREALGESLAKAQQIMAQSRQRKANAGHPKLYAWHAPEVDCISKGKARSPYEFGVKVGVASTLQHNLVVGARAFHGNPYDGHTLWAQLEQATILMQDNAVAPTEVYVDLGYRGVEADNPQVRIVHRGRWRCLSRSDRRRLKRRQAIEPIIGHLKADCRMDRCHLKGERGDRLHAVLCAAGYNIRWLLRMIAKRGIGPLVAVLLRLLLRLLQTIEQAKRALTTPMPGTLRAVG
ncbi:IS5 family transposase [Tepidimonas taiwanensis]|nr:IS5 family transposase [Tepidimonas taiwanensis]UBQ05491.1 IS5 family transposase [Tepidimonas taiwanensis]UBQ06094.1 IS5 family transposase [Tepidimonas taiwanensis]